MKVVIDKGLLESDELASTLRALGTRIAIISDTTTSSLYGNRLVKTIGHEAELFVVPDGEQSKTRKTKEWLEDALLAKKYGRDSCIVALGGGMIMDLAGFVAATYCRGLPLILLPTTLLAMCDACIGGKTAVNVPSAKNMIGAIYHPQAIFMDILSLETLAPKELQNGLVEAIKHGLILDSDYFAFLEDNVEAICACDFNMLKTLITKSYEIKSRIVQEDMYEIGKRRLLNFGHTIGHAVEIVYNIPHGQAVAIGMVAEAYFSYRMNVLSENDFQRVRHILQSYGVDCSFKIDPDAILAALEMDKKALSNIPRFVILSRIGSCLSVAENYCQALPLQTMGWLSDAVYCR